MEQNYNHLKAEELTKQVFVECAKSTLKNLNLDGIRKAKNELGDYLRPFDRRFEIRTDMPTDGPSRLYILMFEGANKKPYSRINS
jgi:hypothetical protein